MDGLQTWQRSHCVHITQQVSVATESNDALISDTIKTAEIIVEDGYDGVRMDTDEAEQNVVTEAFVKDMMDAFKDQKRLHRRYVLVILLAFQKLVKELPSLVDVEVCSLPVYPVQKEDAESGNAHSATARTCGHEGCVPCVW
jgi:hypothetical protein